MAEDKELNLKPINVYAVYASVDDRGPDALYGYYSDSNIAAVKTKGIGWYGSDGRVQMERAYTDGEQIYIVTPKGKLRDFEEKERRQTIESIKSKLTKEELALLNIKE